MDGKSLRITGVQLRPSRRYSERDIHQHLFNRLYVQSIDMRNLNHRHGETNLNSGKTILRSDDFRQGRHDSAEQALERFRSKNVPERPNYDTPNAELPHRLDDLLEAERSLFAQERKLAAQQSVDKSEEYQQGAIFPWDEHKVYTIEQILHIK